MNGSQRYTYEQLREQINEELLKKDMPQKLYKSTNGIFKIIDAIVKTKGDGWASHVLDNNGKQLLSENEQTLFTTTFQPYVDSIITFFNYSSDTEDASDATNTIDKDIQGGAIPDPSK